MKMSLRNSEGSDSKPMGHRENLLTRSQGLFGTAMLPIRNNLADIFFKPPSVLVMLVCLSVGLPLWSRLYINNYSMDSHEFSKKKSWSPNDISLDK